MICTNWNNETFRELFLDKRVVDVEIKKIGKIYEKYTLIFDSGDKLIINKNLVPNIMVDQK